ncbi:MAG: hypothetical protein JXN64_13765 [Spirochaetes bacterium]|nr:hypothetical protein [Spirochaetota bacterium]
MKKEIIIIIFSQLIIGIILSIVFPAFADSNEEKAIDKLSKQILLQSDKLKGKRIGMFKFSSIEGKETPEGARISDLLLEKLIANSSLSFIERSELHKIIMENELEQTGLIDVSLTHEGGKILPIDYMVTGTVAQINNIVNISARVVKANTGEIFIVKSCEYDSKNKIASAVSPEAAALFNKSPDMLDRINRAYLNLKKMSENAPLVFLIVVLNNSETEELEKNNIRLAKALKNRKDSLDKNGTVIHKKIELLRKGLTLMKDTFPSRYDEIMTKKMEVLNNPPRRRR